MRKIMKKVEAVSPIIATLMLVLVSVGGAGAFYIWQTGWQSDVTDTVGTADVTDTLSVGGSSTVYEFIVIAKEIFEAQNPNYRINLQKGGSGSGIAAAGMGLVDIGAASKDASSSFVDYPDLNRDGEKDLGIEMVQTTIAHDGVVIVVDADNTEGLLNISRETVEQIYEAVYSTVTPDLNWDDIPVSATESLGNCLSAEKINTYDRSDESGTEECFCEKLMEKSLTDASKQMAAGYTDFSFGSNQELVAALSDDPYGIGFTAWGIAQNTPGVRIVPFAIGSELATGDGQPSSTEIKSGDWPGSRPLNLLTVGKPTGAEKVFIDFCLMTEMNQLICEQSDYVSIYV